MKKLLIPLLCLFATAPLFADEFTTTTMLSRPVGIFDNMTVTGPTTFGDVEIGAIAPVGGSFFQNQTLIVNGILGLLTPISVGGVDVSLPVEPPANAKINISRSLDLKNGNTADSAIITYAFSNISVLPNGVMIVGHNLELNELNAQTVETASTFSTQAAGTLENLTTAPKARFYKLDGRFLDSPRHAGRKTAWVEVPATDGNTYGPWSQPLPDAAIASAETCLATTHGDAYAPYKCSATDSSQLNGKSCIDVERITVTMGTDTNAKDQYYATEKMGDTGNYTTSGGAFVFDVVGRKTGKYQGNTEAGSPSCVLDADYTIVGPDGSNILECSPGVNVPDNMGDLGFACRDLCLGMCSEQKTCYAKGSGSESSQAGTRTAWPEGSRLECSNMWAEATFKALRCFAGSGASRCGNVKGEGCTQYRWREVKCAKLESGNTLKPGKFLVLDFNEPSSDKP